MSAQITEVDLHPHSPLDYAGRDLVRLTLSGAQWAESDLTGADLTDEARMPIADQAVFGPPGVVVPRIDKRPLYRTPSTTGANPTRTTEGECTTEARRHGGVVVVGGGKLTDRAPRSDQSILFRRLTHDVRSRAYLRRNGTLSGF